MTCKESTCTNQGIARNLCRSHYTQFHRSEKFSKVPVLSTKERYEKYVNRSDKNGCHLWTGGIHGANLKYGCLKVGKKTWAAHRLGWTLYKGEIPKGLCVCHKCDNPLCQNLEHFFLGTYGDNNRDAIQKGRKTYPVGERAPSSKLTNKQVLEIRKRYKNGGVTYYELARQYDVGHSMIGYIINKQWWKHI